MQFILLQDILVIFGLSVIVLYACHRLRIAPIVGFLLTGVLTGPHGFGLVRVLEAIDILAEVGVVLLLFTIGLEFSLRNLLHIRKLAFWGGFLQLSLTFGATMVFERALGRPLAESIFLSFLFSLSSTAIVMKILQERAEVESPHGHAALGILIFQDFMVVPMMLFTPLLSGSGENLGSSLLLFLAEGIGIALLVKFGSQKIVPWVFFQITRTRIPELFILGAILICLAVAWLTHWIGLSLALGAFLFVSIGMLLDLRFLFQQPGMILLITLGAIFSKTFFAGIAVGLVGLPLRTMVLAGMALAQVGEFSFILSKTGLESGLLPPEMYQTFLAISVMTMAATPFLIAYAPAVADLLARLPFPRSLKQGSYHLRGAERIKEKNHLIIVGFGLNGRNISRAAKTSAIPYLVVEVNPDTVREERSKGEPIFFGDATQEAVLRHLHIKEARILVIVINDPAPARRITELARKLNPKIHIIVRTRFLREMEPLYQLGANEVIPEEFETSVEIFSRVLGKYLHPRGEIEKFVAEIRSEGYEMFRTLSREATACTNLTHCLPELELVSLRIEPEAPIIGRTIGEMELRKKRRVTILAIRRGSDFIYNPDPHSELRENDLLIAMGKPEDIAEAAPFFRAKDSTKNPPHPSLSPRGRGEG
ncbi:MAG: cation:proton antiporter [Deltaproteobacteria bacterium]|nr:cation:proton antiporter [Deltaproteobacteria bacterium]